MGFPHGKSSDIWSVGSMVYTLFNGTYLLDSHLAQQQINTISGWFASGDRMFTDEKLSLLDLMKSHNFQEIFLQKRAECEKEFLQTRANMADEDIQEIVRELLHQTLVVDP